MADSSLKPFTSVGENIRGKDGANVRPVCREKYENIRQSEKLKQLCMDIRNGKVELKSNLPYRTPHAIDFDDNHRSDKHVKTAVNRLMVDFDLSKKLKPLEERTEEERAEYWAMAETRCADICRRALELKESGRWKVFEVEMSACGGAHVLISIPQAMTAVEARDAFARDMGYEADRKVQDASRAIFMVTESYVLYQSEDFFTPEVIDKWPGGRGKRESASSTKDCPAKRSSSWRTSCPDTYEGIPVKLIVEELAQEVAAELGEGPVVGNRNDFLYRMSSQLRHICNDDAERICTLLPDRYGLEEREWRGAIASGLKAEEPPHLLERATKRVEAVIRANTPPPLPRRLPELVKLLCSNTPDIYKATVCCAIFPSLAAHLHGVRFRCADNALHEATLMCVLMASTGSGKSCVNAPIDHIMTDIRERDAANLAILRRWKEERSCKGANKDKAPRPKGLVIQEINPDTTHAAFVQYMADAGGHFLYSRMNEIDQFDALKGSGKAGQQFQIICLAFDPDNRYGQTRVSDLSVSETVCIRYNWNASTTIRKGQEYFKRVLTDGPISRINFCTIPEQPLGTKQPVFGNYDTAFDEALRPYIEHLCQAKGIIGCPQGDALAKKLVQHCKEQAVLTQNRVYDNLSQRASIIAYLKAMVLYVANGEQWDKSIEHFALWSLKYDLWCKMQFFGPAIEAAEKYGSPVNLPGPQNLLDLLPEVFTRNDLHQLRIRRNINADNTAHNLSVWKQRGYIKLANENDPHTFRKTAAYLKDHQQTSVAA